MCAKIVQRCGSLYCGWDFVIVQSFSHAYISATPWTSACQASLSFTVFWSLLKPKSIESVCHPTFLSSVVPVSSCLQSFPALESFPMSRLFACSGQSIRISASASDSPMNIQDWFTLGLTGLISLHSKGLSKGPLQHHSSKSSVLWHSTFFIIQLSHPYMTTGKS